MNVRWEAFRILNRLFRGERIFLDKDYSSSIKAGKLLAVDRSFLVHLVRGVVKYSSHLQHMVSTYLQKPKSLPKKVQIILYLGFFQLSIDSRIPDYAVVSETVELARLTRARPWIKLINAVLRRASSDRKFWQDASIDWGITLPQWIENEWRHFFNDEEFLRLKKSLAQPPYLFLQVNSLKIGDQELIDRLQNNYSFSIHPTLILPDAFFADEDYTQLVETNEYQNGLFSIHDLSSQLVIHFLSPQAGEKIVDIGCGSGGKAIMMAKMMKNQGRIYAVDTHPKKLKTLENIAQRQGIKIIHPILADATRPLPKELQGADRVIVDAPCSGWGTLRRNPEIILLREQSQNQALAEKQLQLLNCASDLVEKNGIMLYCVCTITSEETYGVTEAFERSNSKKWERIIPQEIQLGPKKNRRIITPNGSFIVWPHFFNSDGFFGMAWRKL